MKTKFKRYSKHIVDVLKCFVVEKYNYKNIKYLASVIFKIT